MNTYLKEAFAAGCAMLVICLCTAAVRQSASYVIESETIDDGGMATSTSYALSASVETFCGGSSNAAMRETACHGFMGQQYDVIDVTLTAAPTSVGEEGTRQAFVQATLDDETILALVGNDASWSVDGWPLVGVNDSGLVTASSVYADTTGVVRATFDALPGSLDLTVLDTVSDNFGIYAADSLNDNWQVGWFGSNNPNGVADADGDEDRQDNRFEYTAGTDPTDGNSRFQFWIESATDQSTHRNLCLTPVLPDRTYTLRACTDLRDISWINLSCPSEDTGNQRTFTDTNTTFSTRFYQIGIEYP